MFYFDKYMIACVKCGHCWVIGSDKYLPDLQYWTWVKEVMAHHKQIHEGKDYE